MRALLPGAFVLLSTVVTPTLLAQDADGPTSSFEALPLVLKVGQEVKVRDVAWRESKGRSGKAHSLEPLLAWD